MRRDQRRAGSARAAWWAAALAAFAALAGLAPPAGTESVPASRRASRIGLISIQGPIDDLTLRSVERRLDEAKAAGCDAIVFELDTPGGDLYATLALTHLIKTEGPANCVAWVRPRAFSAGAITALACREIVVAPGAAIGDAAPIAVSPFTGIAPLPAAERAKLESPVLAEVEESARRHGHDERLVRGFVNVAEESWLVERDDRTRLFVDAGEYATLFGEEPPRTGNRGPPPAPPAMETDGTATPIVAGDPSLPLVPRVDAAERGRWKLLGPFDTADELVTLRADEAVAYGLARAEIADEDALARWFGATAADGTSPIVRFDETWSEAFARFLMSWPVRLVLVAAMLICFVLELGTPGLGVFGLAGAAILVVLVAAPTIAGMAEWWELLLIAIGLGLVAVELLVLPGTGIAGFLGAACLLVGLVFAFVGRDLGSPQSQASMLTGLFATLGSFALATGGIWVLLRSSRNLQLFRAIVVEATVDSPSAIDPPAARPVAPVGAVGEAITDLRPAGRAAFGDDLVDVRSGGEWIPRGAKVRVVSRDALGPVVEELSP
jgi:membrane-bound serine protease (ClpP class)